MDSAPDFTSHSKSGKLLRKYFHWNTSNDGIASNNCILGYTSKKKTRFKQIKLGKNPTLIPHNFPISMSNTKNFLCSDSFVPISLLFRWCTWEAEAINNKWDFGIHHRFKDCENKKKRKSFPIVTQLDIQHLLKFFFVPSETYGQFY